MHNRPIQALENTERKHISRSTLQNSADDACAESITQTEPVLDNNSSSGSEETVPKSTGSSERCNSVSTQTTDKAADGSTGTTSTSLPLLSSSNLNYSFNIDNPTNLYPNLSIFHGSIEDCEFIRHVKDTKHYWQNDHHGCRNYSYLRSLSSSTGKTHNPIELDRTTPDDFLFANGSPTNNFSCANGPSPIDANCANRTLDGTSCCTDRIPVDNLGCLDKVPSAYFRSPDGSSMREIDSHFSFDLEP